MISRIALKDLQKTGENLNPGKLESRKENTSLYSGRDILTLSRGGTWYLKTNCWVVSYHQSERQDYWHGDKTQARNEQDARDRHNEAG